MMMIIAVCIFVTSLLVCSASACFLSAGRRHHRTARAYYLQAMRDGHEEDEPATIEIPDDCEDPKIYVMQATIEDMILEYGDEGRDAAKAYREIGYISIRHGARPLAIAIKTLERVAINMEAAGLSPSHTEQDQ